LSDQAYQQGIAVDYSWCAWRYRAAFQTQNANDRHRQQRDKARQWTSQADIE
jgi:hypothetical protein